MGGDDVYGRPLNELEEILGYRFVDRELAIRAVTHRSYVHEAKEEAASSYERLEFLGDVVLGLLVSEELMVRHPDLAEGSLSRLRADLVSERCLAGMAAAADLGAFMRLGRGEEVTGGRAKVSLLADVTESLLAAVYLDGGLEAARGVCLRLLGERLDRAEPGVHADFKTRLQELAAALGLPAPTYEVVGELGPVHTPTFTVEAAVGRFSSRGSGSTKRKAGQHAAMGVLLGIQGQAAEGGRDEAIDEEGRR